MNPIRVCRGVVLAFSMLVASAAAGLDFRQDPSRAGITLVGDPVLLNYEQLTQEMYRNIALDEWVKSYGRPDYAEAQRIEFDEPFASYEVHLYYLDGNRAIVFGRVHISPSLPNYGVRKFISNIDAEKLGRLLTAKPLGAQATAAAYDSAAPASRSAEESQAVGGEIFAEPAEMAAAPAEVEIVAAPATERQDSEPDAELRDSAEAVSDPEF